MSTSPTILTMLLFTVVGHEPATPMISSLTIVSDDGTAYSTENSDEKKKYDVKKYETNGTQNKDTNKEYNAPSGSGNVGQNRRPVYSYSQTYTPRVPLFRFLFRR